MLRTLESPHLLRVQLDCHLFFFPHPLGVVNVSHGRNGDRFTYVELDLLNGRTSNRTTLNFSWLFKIPACAFFPALFVYRCVQN